MEVNQSLSNFPGNSSSLAIPETFSQAAIIGIYTPVGLIILTWNIITMINLWKTELKHEGLWVLLFSMALSDASVGVTCILHGFNKSLKTLLTSGWCFIRFSTMYCVVIVSLGNVALLALDRCLALSLPFKYLNIATKRHAIIASVILWIVASSLAFIRATQNISSCLFMDLVVYGEVLNVPVAAFFIALTIIIGSYTIIIYHVKVQLRKIGHGIPRVQALQNPGMAVTSPGNIRPPNNRLRYLKTVTSVLGLFMFCYLPLMFLYSYYIIYPSEMDQSRRHFGLQNSFLFLVLCNSFFNPMLYTWKTRELQITFLKLFCKRSKYCQTRLRQLQSMA